MTNLEAIKELWDVLPYIPNESIEFKFEIDTSKAFGFDLSMTYEVAGQRTDKVSELMKMYVVNELNKLIQNNIPIMLENIKERNKAELTAEMIQKLTTAREEASQAEELLTNGLGIDISGVE